MSQKTAEVDTSVAPVDEATVSAKDIAIQKIVDEVGCTPAEADSCLTWITQFVTAAREGGYGWQYPTTEQMAGRDYAIFDSIMEHGAVATTGSAHEAIQTAVLDPSLGELALTHDDHDEQGSPSFCSVQVAVGVFKTD